MPKDIYHESLIDFFKKLICFEKRWKWQVAKNMANAKAEAAASLERAKDFNKWCAMYLSVIAEVYTYEMQLNDIQHEIAGLKKVRRFAPY